MFSLGQEGLVIRHRPPRCLRFASLRVQETSVSPGAGEGCLAVDLRRGWGRETESGGNKLLLPFVKLKQKFFSNIKCSVFSTFAVNSDSEIYHWVRSDG